jgi:hypothetical protein
MRVVIDDEYFARHGLGSQDTGFGSKTPIKRLELGRELEWRIFLTNESAP